MADIPSKPENALRVVAWNTNMALHRKLQALSQLEPDVAIVSECANPETLRQRLPTNMQLPSMVWVGGTPNKGLGILGFGPFTVELSETYDKRLQWILPARLHGPLSITVLGVWANNHRASEFHPLEPRTSQALQALEIYRAELGDGRAIIAGDFNANAIWDSRRRYGNWSSTVEAYCIRGFESAYHLARKCDLGNEPEPTLYWQSRKKDGRAYHVDYCFIPTPWRASLRAVYVGSHEEFVATGLSDHVPLVVDLDASALR